MIIHILLDGKSIYGYALIGLFNSKCLIFENKAMLFFYLDEKESFFDKEEFARFSEKYAAESIRIIEDFENNFTDYEHPYAADTSKRDSLLMELEKKYHLSGCS